MSTVTIYQWELAYQSISTMTLHWCNTSLLCGRRWIRNVYDCGDRSPMHRFCHSEDRQVQLELPQQQRVTLRAQRSLATCSDDALKRLIIVQDASPVTLEIPCLPCLLLYCVFKTLFKIFWRPHSYKLWHSCVSLLHIYTSTCNSVCSKVMAKSSQALYLSTNMTREIATKTKINTWHISSVLYRIMWYDTIR